MTVITENKADTTLSQEKIVAQSSEQQNTKKEANQQQQPKQDITSPEKQPESPEDPNWKAFREARKKDRAERGRTYAEGGKGYRRRRLIFIYKINSYPSEQYIGRPCR